MTVSDNDLQEQSKAVRSQKTRQAALCFCLVANSMFMAAAQAQALDTVELRAEALDALGGEALDGIELSGAGWDACLGQAWSVAEGWARWQLTDYRRLINYDNGGVSSHSAQRRAGMDPGRLGGCGAQPDADPAPQQSFIDSSASWPEQLLIWLTPHGFLRLLDDSGTASTEQVDNGWQVTLPLAREGIDYTVVADFNEDFELRQLTTWIDDAVFGDMEVRMAFGSYHDFGAVTFPDSLTLEQGGFATLHLELDAVAPYADTVENNIPPRAARPPAATEGPAYEEISPGIFAFHGGYQSVAVEFDDFAMVIDGLQSDARVQALIALVKEAIPGKPIRYVLSTHSHFDHASGLRQFAAEGATILTHHMNVVFFREALSTPRTLRLDATEPDTVPAKIQGVTERLVISDDAGQVVEVHALGESAHAADMLVAYLPSIKAVVEADVLQPWINPVFGGDNGPHPMLVYLAEGLERIGLDYARFVPIHVPPMPPIMERADLEAVLSGQE